MIIITTHIKYLTCTIVYQADKAQCFVFKQEICMTVRYHESKTFSKRRWEMYKCQLQKKLQFFIWIFVCKIQGENTNLLISPTSICYWELPSRLGKINAYFQNLPLQIWRITCLFYTMALIGTILQFPVKSWIYNFIWNS